MTDNGAKALADRLHEVGIESAFGTSTYRDDADAILANGAVFLTAEEAERLRRIEAAARDVAPAWDRAVLGAVKGGYGPINAEFGDVADMVKVLRAALTEPSHD